MSNLRFFSFSFNNNLLSGSSSCTVTVANTDDNNFGATIQPQLTTLTDVTRNNLNIPILSYTETHINCDIAQGGLAVRATGSVTITMTYASNSIISGNTYTATFAFGDRIYQLYPYEYRYATTIAISGAPGAPTIVSATPGNGLATLLFRAPTSIGSSAITSYTVTLNNVVISPITTTGADMSITATGLTNGTSYTFTATATNAAGPGTASSILVTPRTVPGAPTIVSATPGVGLVTVRFTPPTSNGGSVITSYTVIPSSGTNVTGAGTAISGSTDRLLTVTGLTNGTSYTFTVKATNVAGTGTPSSSSSATPRTVPNVPTAVSATPGNGSAIVTFTAPAFNGGSDISGYTVTSSPGGFTGTGTSSPITVSGLINGTSYTFTVTATNEAGTGAASSPPSAAVTPRTVPNAPTAVTAVPGNGLAIVSFTAPAFNGGSVITGYTVTSSPGGFTGTGTSSPITVNELINGTSYTFTVKATNAAGPGTPSSSSSATPRTVPGAPTGVSAIRDGASAIVSFTPPASNGGAAITGYTVTTLLPSTDSSSPPTIIQTTNGTSSPITVNGLTEGTSYAFMVMATNEAGNSTKASSAAGVSCFVEGTRILTQAGYKAVEALKSDDVIVTADNRAVAFRLLKTTLPTTTDRIAPYLIQPHAFGRNLPSAPIRLSPTHKIQIGKGLWTSAEKAARSNPLITQCEIGAPVTYYHIECKEFLRDNLVTEGLVVESFGSKRATGGRKDIYTWSKHLNAYTRIAYGSVVSKAATA